MVTKVFVLGRPGSGKTTAVRHIIELTERRGYPVSRNKDYDILYEMFLTDIRQEVFYPADYGGFIVHDFSVLDIALEKLENKVQAEIASIERGLFIIEFARSDYREALKHFTPDFLKDSYFLFVAAKVEICIQRIHKRVTCSNKLDNHYVSDIIVRGYYGKDNSEYMMHNLARDYGISKKVEVIKNNDTMQVFVEHISQFAEVIFRQEDHTLRKTSLFKEIPSLDSDEISELFVEVIGR